MRRSRSLDRVNKPTSILTWNCRSHSIIRDVEGHATLASAKKKVFNIQQFLSQILISEYFSCSSPVWM